MKLKLCLYLAFCSAFIQPVQANLHHISQSAGLQYINTRGKIYCGTEAGNKILAYQDKSGNWKGMDVELCKMLSTAIFGQSDHFKMIPLSANQISNALATNKIDVMIGGLPYSATTEISTNAQPVDVWYYDHQVFLAHTIKNANSMEAYKGSKVCVVNNTDDLAKLIDLNESEKDSIKYYNQGEALFICGNRRMRITVIVTQEELDSFGSGGGL